MMFTETGLESMQTLEGAWLELRNGEGATLGMFPMVENEQGGSEFIALDPIVLIPGSYEVTIYNENVPVVEDLFTVRVEHILFGYAIEQHPDRIVGVTKMVFRGSLQEWYCYLGM